ncbi:MAG: hypothetical protein K0R24_1007 [Gammaproteobacteria bacterium]|jgi:hypothetical protein|nr:hypothetical protein [Gammaproteobacteria bacterium]
MIVLFASHLPIDGCFLILARIKLPVIFIFGLYTLQLFPKILF